MIRVMGAVIALLCVLSGFLGYRLESTSHSLELLQTQHKSLQRDYDVCIEDKKVIQETKQITSNFLVNQRQELFEVKDQSQSDLEALLTFKPVKCPNVCPTGETKNEVDIDAPFSPEFIRVSEGSD